MLNDHEAPFIVRFNAARMVTSAAFRLMKHPDLLVRLQRLEAEVITAAR